MTGDVLTIEHEAIRLDFYEAVDIVNEELDGGDELHEALGTAIEFVLDPLDGLPEMMALLEVLYDEGHMDFDHETVLAVVLTELPDSDDEDFEESVTDDIDWEMPLEKVVRGNDDFGAVIAKFTHAALVHAVLDELGGKIAV